MPARCGDPSAARAAPRNKHESTQEPSAAKDLLAKGLCHPAVCSEIWEAQTQSPLSSKISSIFDPAVQLLVDPLLREVEQDVGSWESKKSRQDAINNNHDTRVAWKYLPPTHWKSRPPAKECVCYVVCWGASVNSVNVDNNSSTSYNLESATQKTRGLCNTLGATSGQHIFLNQ